MFICPPRGVFPFGFKCRALRHTFPSLFYFKVKMTPGGKSVQLQVFFKILFILKSTGLWPETKNVTETVTSFLR